MILAAALIFGIALGWRHAGRLGGNRKDRLQYAAVYALILSVIGLFASIIIDRMI